MKATQLGRLLCSSLFVVSLFNSVFNSAIAQESFTISGPIDSFSSISTDGIPEVTASSFSATIWFDPDAVMSETEVREGESEEAYFEPAIIGIEFIVLDESDNEITKIINSSASGLNEGNYINVFNDLSGTFEDQILYYLFVQSSSDGADASETSTASSSMSALNRTVILFGDTSGGMINDPTQLPPPPGPEDFTSSIISVSFMETGAGFFRSITASGRIEDIVFEASDPYKHCADARNHGQYVSCVAEVSNSLRALGEITGKEKGEHQKQAASRSKK